jgi:hypothetical protein
MRPAGWTHRWDQRWNSALPLQSLDNSLGGGGEGLTILRPHDGGAEEAVEGDVARRGRLGSTGGHKHDIEAQARARRCGETSVVALRRSSSD